ncbi:receptor-type tyrosine-protein phosphatase epsilon-like [Ctenocephalides felis]|uniref:receptor-type tyrosine-protein phosphatase epsilon-like n=1 Tax=Ctenocephalides felis TaxID=7515 RepID=UPI000E6E52E0|nr:receptor-type tyrosine-protein phosphatase epsilon-like [Ctenocephalides felis]
MIPKPRQESLPGQLRAVILPQRPSPKPSKPNVAAKPCVSNNKMLIQNSSKPLVDVASKPISSNKMMAQGPNKPLVNVGAKPSAPSNKIVFKGPISRPVDVEDFEHYVKESLANRELEMQHKKFKRGMQKEFGYGIQDANKIKNRYLNLIAYDSSRVVLKKLPNDKYSDYINANYVDGFLRPKEYIATQGPKQQTVNDFWRMVWQEQVTAICMLTNIKESDKIKCHQYWPEQEGSEESYGDIKVEHRSSRIYADFVYRTLNITNGSESYILEHLHFTAWPDHGVPLYPEALVPFINKMQSIQSDQTPTIVHCSAGVGRTGTIILADICIKMARATGKIDILYYQNKIREQRANLVDSSDQYKLVHMVVLETLLGEPTSIPCENLKSAVAEMKRNNTLFDNWIKLDKVAWKDDYLKCADNKPSEEDLNRKENRNKIVSGTRGRVFLSRFPLSDANSDYINAVFVDGFRIKDQFIVTHFPLHHTVSDFWRMISDKEISLVGVLNKIDTSDESVPDFIPNETKEILSPIPQLAIKYKNKFETEYCFIITVDFKDTTKSKEVNKIVTIVQIKNWNKDKVLPTAPGENLDCLPTFWEQLQKLTCGDAKILLTCFDGATACGLFVAMVFCIEKLKLEQECDVPLAIRTIRKHRKEFVRNQNQYQYIYDAALKFLEDFEIYSNFQ